MGNVTLEAVRLTKRFGTRIAVHELNLVARQGEIVGLLGPNGAGKTTAIRLLSTVLPPSSGQFTVAGVPHSRPIELRRRIGVLPESGGYPPHLTGIEYLRFHARLFGLGRTAVARTTERLLADVGLAERGTSRILTYSRGMRQRLGIARALVNDPAVLFLDEPTLGLDPAGQRDVHELVRTIARDRRTTVVLSTHILPDVEELCTTVLILDGGMVRLTGTVSEVMGATGVRQSGRLRVPIDLVDRARSALAGISGVSLVDGGQPDGVITISVTGQAHSRADEGMNLALYQVLDAGVPILRFEVDGARLNTAFLALTGEAGR
jgi:ABC-2 type transport system ATP-binding protein